MKFTAYMLTIATAFATLVIVLDAMSKHYSIAATGFLFWAISPYVVLALLIKNAKSKTVMAVALLVSIGVCLFGLILLVDAMYINKDAQGGLVFVVAPFWQWIGLLVVTVPVLLLNKIKNT
jgi:hypothetical protein